MSPAVSKEMIKEWLRLRALELAPDLAKLKEEYIQLHSADASDPSGRMAELRREIRRQEQLLRDTLEVDYAAQEQLWREGTA